MGANCSASLSVGALFCVKCCNADNLRSTLAYIPPESPSYTVEDFNDGVEHEGGRLVYNLEKLKNLPSFQMAVDACLVCLVETRQAEKIPIVWVAEHYATSCSSSEASFNQRTSGSPRGRTKKKPANCALIQGFHQDPADPMTPTDKSDDSVSEDPLLYVMIYCHGNATDIGLMMSVYWELAKEVGVVVVGVEYAGYGVSTGEARLRNTYADVEAAYMLALEWGVPADRIIVYGQSIGSGPAMWLANQYPVAGVIFHSPFLSGIRVIDPEPDKCCRPSSVFSCFDFYKNIYRVKNVTSPVLIIHGKKDDVVPFQHGQELYNYCNEDSKVEPYFPENAGHHDVVEHNPPRYYAVVKGFVDELERRRVDGLRGWDAPSQVGMSNADEKFMMKETPAEVKDSSWIPFSHGPVMESTSEMDSAKEAQKETASDSKKVQTGTASDSKKVQDMPPTIRVIDKSAEKPKQQTMLSPQQDLPPIVSESCEPPEKPTTKVRLSL